MKRRDFIKGLVGAVSIVAIGLPVMAPMRTPKRFRMRLLSEKEWYQRRAKDPCTSTHTHLDRMEQQWRDGDGEPVGRTIEDVMATLPSPRRGKGLLV